MKRSPKHTLCQSPRKWPQPLYPWLCLVALLCIPWQVFAQKLRIEVDGPNFKPYPLAVHEVFDVSSNSNILQPLLKPITALIRKDIDLQRSFLLLPPSSYVATEKDITSDPHYLDWSNIGASGLLRVSAQWSDRGLILKMRLDDMPGKIVAFSHSCVTTTALDYGSCVHRLLDKMFEKMTGELGVLSSQIAFVKKEGRHKKIYLSDMDGFHHEVLVDHEGLSLLPSWDKLGRYVFFTNYMNGNPDLYRIDTRNHLLSAISQQKGLNVGANISPDGKRMVITLSKDGNTEIYVMDVDGKNLHRLTNSLGEEVSPTWSPDGQRIAFVSSRSGQPHIYVMHADGSEQKRLTFQGTYNQEPDWSPRANGQIVFTARDEKLHYDLFLVDPQTAQLTRLTQDQGHNESPSFSPDGQFIVFTSTRSSENSRKLWLMHADGTHQQMIFEQGGPEVETPAWGPRLYHDD